MVDKSLKKVFSLLGLGSKHALVYETLLSTTISTPLSLSRATRLNRSSLYRYLEELMQNNLAEEIIEGKTKKYRATAPDNLKLIIAKQEARLLALKEEVPLLIKKIGQQTGDKIEGTKVKYYRGVEGLRQLLWNVVSSKTEFLGLGYENWNTSVGKKFAEQLREKMLQDKTKSREITNQVDESYSYTEHGRNYQAVYAHRPLPKDILEIYHDTYIYKDVFAYYYHYKGELFGVEIHNAMIAQTEKMVFEILWKLAGKEKLQVDS